MTLQEAIQKYGAIERGIWTRAAEFCVVVEVPAELAKTLINSATGKPCLHIYCNRDIAEALKAVFAEIIAQGLTGLLKTFDGCFEVRTQRGCTAMSEHCWAIAVDFNAKENVLGSTPQMDPRIVAIFEKHKFNWGGFFRRVDGMHFQWGDF